MAEAERAGVAARRELDDEAIQAALRASEDPTAVALAEDPASVTLIRASASIEGALAACDVVGGTAPERVAAALAVTHARLDGETRPGSESVPGPALAQSPIQSCIRAIHSSVIGRSLATVYHRPGSLDVVLQGPERLATWSQVTPISDGR